MLPSTAMQPQEELEQLLARQEALNQELKAKKKELQDAQRRQRDNLQKQIRRAQARISAAERKRRTRRLILLGAYLDRRMDTDAALKADVMASLTESLEHDRDRALFGDDLRPTSSDAPPAAALDPDPQTPPVAGGRPASSTRAGARCSKARRWPTFPRATSCAVRRSASLTDGATPGPRPSPTSSADATSRSWSRQAASRAAGEATPNDVAGQKLDDAALGAAGP